MYTALASNDVVQLLNCMYTKTIRNNLMHNIVPIKIATLSMCMHVLYQL